MPRNSSKVPKKVSFKYPVAIDVSRPRFKVSTALAHIDAARLARQKRVEIEVGKFVGRGCGSTVSALVESGRVIQLKVTPCEETIAVPIDDTLKKLLSSARKQLGTGSPPPVKFRPMAFRAFQEEAGDITVKTITCTQICIWGHCIVCCTLPQGGFYCGSTLIIHTDP